MVKTQAFFTHCLNLSLCQSLNSLLGLARCVGNVCVVRSQRRG
ncbi:hypothetical protein GLYMA_12G066251v4 [Glycine max]|nr:hypothetical protein GYH30_032910 [Glycine max]KRH24846.2 hypothetical protein GLYMA_12G066251v4 [Glycine max]